MDAVIDLIVTVLVLFIIELQRRQIKELDERVSELEENGLPDNQTHTETE